MNSSSWSYLACINVEDSWTKLVQNNCNTMDWYLLYFVCVYCKWKL